MPTQIKIFYCYAMEDQSLINGLNRHLAALRRSGQIETWHDHDIQAGAEWRHEIDEHLHAADIILLLVSPHFLDSDYCYGREMQRALERHKIREAYVIP